jgi:hypothetical protein
MLEIQLGHPGAQLQDPEPQMMVKKMCCSLNSAPYKSMKIGGGGVKSDQKLLFVIMTLNEKLYKERKIEKER